MPVYKTKWDSYNFLITLGILVPVFSVMMILTKTPFVESIKVVALLLLFVMALLLLMYFTTSYCINDGYLKYRTLFIFGKVKIENIHKLDVGKTLYVGMRPAFARGGIIVRYNRYDEIYISPTENDDFVNELLKIKPDIEVQYHAVK